MRLPLFLQWAVPAGCIALLVIAYRQYGWLGLALAVTGICMWLLLHVTRLMKVMERAAQRPRGYVASAVMLHSKLNKGHSLMHVVALTRSLGDPVSAIGADPEVFAWRDASASVVECEFRGGKLQNWKLNRPAS